MGRTTRLLVGESSGSRTVTHNVSYFHPGHAPGHVHDPEEEVFYVDEGVGEVWIDGVPFALRPGTVVHTPMGVEHNIHVTGSTPMRIIGSFSPHVIPGRYPNLPPRSRDLAEPPTNTASFVVHSNLDDVTPGQLLIATDRITIALRNISMGDSCEMAADGGDLIGHILVGKARIAAGQTTYRLRPASVVVLTGDERATITTLEPVRLLEVASLGRGGR